MTHLPMSELHEPRLGWQEFKALAPEADAAMQRLGGAAAAHGIDAGLLELVKLRASQINGCAFCLAYHVAVAQRLGVPADKLHMLPAWREAAQYDARERAALGWAEALTRLEGGAVPDAAYEAALAAFGAQGLAYLTSAVMAINAWNRLAIAYRFAPLPIPAAPARSAA